MRLLLVMSIISSLEALHCDKEFNFVEFGYENGYDIICQGLTNKHISLLQNISIINELSLKIENCTLTDVTSNIFQNVANIKHLYLENSTFSFSRSEAIFEIVCKLEQLTIINTRFKPTKISLSKLFNLKKLILTNNQITSIEAGAFIDLGMLSALHITENKLTDLNSLPLCELKNLRTLNLTRNRIEHLDEAFYCETTENDSVFYINNFKSQTSPSVTPSITSTELYQIDLSFNSIKDLSVSFAFLKSLKSVNLQGNLLRRINSTYFTYLEYLEDLQVSDNIISIIDDKVFENKRFLEKIDISNNKITNINFRYLDSLKYLNLRNNSFSLESLLTFNKTNNLNILLLSLNKITVMKPNIFQKLELLQTLDLSYNNVVLFDGSFRGLINLTYLRLNNNNIATLPTKLFKDLKTLRVLDLSQNKIKNIEDNDMFDNLINLETLNLSRNSLTQINYDLLQPLDSLTVLDISHNYVHYIDYDTIISNLPSLSFFNIRYNNLSCGLLTKIINYLKMKGVSYTIQEVIASDKVNIGGIYCTDDIIIAKSNKPEKHVLFDIILGLVIVFGFVILSIIIFKSYIYLKRRRYRADEFELIEDFTIITGASLIAQTSYQNGF
ncbi:chaoptin-like [Diorhabda carinulata]|uniref:chaoptin-like n=1 Tax=Diorhabda carinulata TaxID=1163345 RepID=UPI0025A13D44|nr:chaoptin-like [Diorhabda carinulata]